MSSLTMTRRCGLLLLCLAAAGPTALLRGAEPAVVSLTIDYGDGSEKRFTAIAWSEGLTVFDALTAAGKHPRGIKLTKQGSGELTLVTAIDDLKNDGRGKNWVYRVNEKLADRSCAVFKLKAGDAIEWKYSAEQP